ncbi:hypothetical protein ACFT9I_39495 [Streptomyces sp. NPDC057137]|uniref:hypothetical protein n=1 Tax=Streptomyces sp. NPDC057137 TaxID=3346030 RepID=UPI0036352318
METPNRSPSTLAEGRRSPERYSPTVMLMEDGRAEVLKITVPETGLAAGLKPGVMVRPVELFATPWARIFNGQLSDGVAYRAALLELVTVEAAQ